MGAELLEQTAKLAGDFRMSPKTSGTTSKRAPRLPALNADQGFGYGLGLRSRGRETTALSKASSEADAPPPVSRRGGGRRQRRRRALSGGAREHICGYFIAF